MELHSERGREVASQLFEAFQNSGIHGQKEMPEDTPPAGVEESSLEHLLFITLTVSIDYQRDAVTLWKRARAAFENPQTRYLFDPQSVHETSPEKLKQDMMETGFSQKHENDCFIWRTNSGSFLKRWQGDPRNFLADCNWDAVEILSRLRSDTHTDNNKSTWDFPFLRGPKIGPLWIRMLRDNLKYENLRRLEEVPIPVDIHVAKASLCLGLVTGEYKGALVNLFDSIRSVWKDSTLGLYHKGRDMIALDVDEPLWTLSRVGCKSRDPATGKCLAMDRCEVREYCIPGQIQIEKTKVLLRT